MSKKQEILADESLADFTWDAEDSVSTLVEEPEDTLIESEKVKLDLWHYEEQRLQPRSQAWGHHGVLPHRGRVRRIQVVVGLLP